MKRTLSIFLSIVMLVSCFSFALPQTVIASTEKGVITGLSNKNSGVQVKWSKDTTKAGYYIYRKAGSNSWKKVKTITSYSKTSWIDTNTSNGTKHVYKVYSYKGSKTTKNNKTKTIVRLVTPTIKSLYSPSAGQLRVKSDENKKASGYQIKYSRNSDFSSSKKLSVSGTKLSSLIKELSTDRKYYVKIRAYKSLSGVKYYSAFSTVSSCRTKDISKYAKEVVELAKKINSDWTTVYVQSAVNEISNGKHKFDCSGFVSYCLNTTMEKYCPLYKVTSSVQRLGATDYIYNKGEKGEFKATKVYSGKWDSSKVKVGDILFFNIDSYNSYDCGYNHCGIYIGNNKMIHCSKTYGGVVKTSIEGTYARDFVKAMNFVPDEVTPMNKKVKALQWTAIFADPNGDKEVAEVEPGTAITILFTRDNKLYVQMPNGKKYYMFHEERLG